MLTFNDWPWRHWQRQYPTHIALYTGQHSISWQQLCQHVDRLTTTLRQQGIGQHTIALRGKNSPQLLLSLLALWQCGARVLLLNPQLPQPLLAQLHHQLAIDYGLDLTAEPHIANLPLCSLPDWHSLNDQPTTAGIHTDIARHSAHQASSSPAQLTPANVQQNSPACAPWQPDEPLSLTLTSGSTGLPKAAAHSARAHLASARGVLSLIPFQRTDCWLLSLPLFHVSGLGILWRWLLAGARLAVRNAPLPQALAGCTHASLVPTQLWRLLQHPPLPTRLKAVLLGGASIPVTLTDAAQQQGIACWCGYGLTEFASTVCAKRADGLADVGSVLPGRELRIVNGEIWLRGDSLAAGYWQAGALRPLLNAEGWFATRDGGEWSHDHTPAQDNPHNNIPGNAITCDTDTVCSGTTHHNTCHHNTRHHNRLHIGNDNTSPHRQRLIITGRLDNLFFCGGESVQPEHTERIIAAHPAIQQIFIVPLDDDEFGQIPVAVIDCPPTTDLSALAHWCSKRLTRYQQPRHWLSLPAHLQNGGIKISRQQLRQWVQQTLATAT